MEDEIHGNWKVIAAWSVFENVSSRAPKATGKDVVEACIWVSAFARNCDPMFQWDSFKAPEKPSVFNLL
jgi:hypothetical protein